MRNNIQGSLKDKYQHEIHAMLVLRVAWRPALHLCCLLILVLTDKTFSFCMGLPPAMAFCRIRDGVWWSIDASLTFYCWDVSSVFSDKKATFWHCCGKLSFSLYSWALGILDLGHGCLEEVWKAEGFHGLRSKSPVRARDEAVLAFIWLPLCLSFLTSSLVEWDVLQNICLQCKDGSLPKGPSDWFTKELIGQ